MVRDEDWTIFKLSTAFLLPSLSCHFLIPFYLGKSFRDHSLERITNFNWRVFNIGLHHNSCQLTCHLAIFLWVASVWLGQHLCDSKHVGRTWLYGYFPLNRNPKEELDFKGPSLRWHSLCCSKWFCKGRNNKTTQKKFGIKLTITLLK